jgi:demethylmenaquinone methyltransferase/2-methoxy-6-polyprenyl-1,4-benzoquinol methylase
MAGSSKSAQTGLSVLPGTRPEGARDERDAAARVREMFAAIAPRYDLLNHLLSLSLDRLWRRRTAAALDHILRLPHARVLDLCCGTGDLAQALKRRAAHSCSAGAAIFASDFAHPMLVLAVGKSRRQSPSSGAASNSPAREIHYSEADALAMPFAEKSFDLVTAAFGFRNLANYEAGLREIFRLLRPGGEVAILEFSEPSGSFFGPLFRFYFHRILPRIGGAISGRGSAYSYLPASVAKFPASSDLTAMMTRAGFSAVQFQEWTGGVVTLHRGVRKAASSTTPGQMSQRGY